MIPRRFKTSKIHPQVKNSIITYIIRFVVLVFFQVLLFNHINFLGYLNPYIYIIFIILAPININKSLFLFLSFALGLSIDFFGDSGGVHAAACLFITYLRPLVLRSVFGLSYEFQTIKLNKVSINNLIVYISLLVIIHHIVLFSLEIFNLSLLLLIAKKILLSSIFSIFVITIILVLFRRKDS